MDEIEAALEKIETALLGERFKKALEAEEITTVVGGYFIPTKWLADEAFFAGEGLEGLSAIRGVLDGHDIVLKEVARLEGQRNANLRSANERLQRQNASLRSSLRDADMAHKARLEQNIELQNRVTGLGDRLDEAISALTPFAGMDAETFPYRISPGYWKRLVTKARNIIDKNQADRLG